MLPYGLTDQYFFVHIRESIVRAKMRVFDDFLLVLHVVPFTPVYTLSFAAHNHH